MSPDDTLPGPDVTFFGWWPASTDPCQRPSQASFHPCPLCCDQKLWVQERLGTWNPFLPSLVPQSTPASAVSSGGPLTVLG